ncbi:MAG: sigma-70 family RNA polymerase sigma factor [Gemmatimonadetes bacterium]|nr:sigma-70 family RNA polymerase sigma factor [Gemmatimonadota bacterium]
MATHVASLPRHLARGTARWLAHPRQDEKPLAAPDYAALEDRELATLAAAGREAAFRELLTRYERPVFSLIYRMVRDRTQAEDLAQEAFVRAFNAIGSYKTSYKFSNWILKIANNHTIDHLRKRRIATISIHGSPHATTAEEVSQTELVVASHDENPHQHLEHKELGTQIEKAIGGLRDEYRTAVLLRHVEGYAYDEIAEIMDVPLGTVKTYLHRARAELRESLAPVTS